MDKMLQKYYTMDRMTYEEDILEHLTVNDGKPMYIESGKTKSKRSSKTKSKQRIYAPDEGSDEERQRKPAEVHYEEHYEIHEEYCIHQRNNVNQGITMCDIDQDVTMCASCPYRKSRTVKCKVSSASAKV